MKILYFDSVMQDSLNGGNIGSNRNLQMATDAFGEPNVEICRLQKPSNLQILRNLIFDRSYYYSNENNIIIKKSLSKGPYDFIFLNGPLAYKYVKSFIGPQTIIYLYCHNVDYDYYWNKFRISRSIKDYLMAKYVKRMEAYAVKNANIISTLNNRDSNGLLKWYDRGADFILPIGMEALSIDDIKSDDGNKINYGLFVGSDIGPNIEGLNWFFKYVAPYTPNVKYQIVGSCCDYFNGKDVPPNIMLKGRVEDLTTFYKNASFVICPIFSGSGMKTKTIEALRYGKTIIGTTEAFEGIDIEFDKVGIRTDNPKHQIDMINSLDLDCKINESSLSNFEKKYTFKVIFDIFKNNISKILHDNKK